MIRDHPNATVALVGAAGGGNLVQWFVNDVLGWGVPVAGTIAIAGGVAFVALYVGRRGLRGTVRDVWAGRG